MKKAHVLGGGLYKKFIEECGFKVVNNIRKADLILFTGGTDVNPLLYNQYPHPYTSSPDTERDKIERDIFLYAKRKRISMAGICRGSQFLCVMNGGSLVQDITGHTYPHQVTAGRDIFIVTSTHHQMMQPKNGDILAVASNLKSSHYQGESGKPVIPRPTDEIEAVSWPETKSLGIQWHPEYMDSTSKAYRVSRKWIRDLVK